MNNDFLKPVISWISQDKINNIYTASYWNDVETEKSKDWWIVEGEYSRCRAYLETSGLLRQWQTVEAFLESKGLVNLEVADLAAGIGWTSALLSLIPAVNRVHATEISQHRLLELFPHAVSMFNGNAKKIHRYLGSFYELNFREQSMDIVFMSQAFHHADQPLLLLSEVNRILKPGGYLIMIGENYIGYLKYFRKILSTLVKERKLISNFYELFPPNGEMGDHYYRLSDYYLFGRLLGYIMQHKILDSDALIVIGKKGC